jgi:hypothetical protein
MNLVLIAFNCCCIVHYLGDVFLSKTDSDEEFYFSRPQIAKYNPEDVQALALNISSSLVSVFLLKKMS